MLVRIDDMRYHEMFFLLKVVNMILNLKIVQKSVVKLVKHNVLDAATQQFLIKLKLNVVVSIICYQYIINFIIIR